MSMISLDNRTYLLPTLIVSVHVVEAQGSDRWTVMVRTKQGLFHTSHFEWDDFEEAQLHALDIVHKVQEARE